MAESAVLRVEKGSDSMEAAMAQLNLYKAVENHLLLKRNYFFR